MSRLEQLIQEYCPNGVSYPSLSKVCRFQNGFAFKSGLFKSEGFPVLRITNIVDGKLSDGDYVYFDKSDYKVFFSQYKVPHGAVVVAMSGATTGKIGYNDSETEYYLNQRVGMFIPNTTVLSNRYLYHWLMSQSKKIYNISSGVGAQPNLSSTKMMEFKIPVPPLEVQNEIVRILDSFTELTAELEAELEARNKQYEYYRDKLLHLDGEHITIQELFDTRNGFTPSKDNPEFWENGDLPWFKLDDINNKGRVLSDSYLHITPKALKKSGLFPENSIIISTSATIGEYALITVPFLCNQRFTCMTVKPIYREKVDIKYLMHYCPMLSKYCKEHLNQGNFASVDMKQFMRFEFVIPSLDEQKHIVEILDRFDALCNDISAGLPAEIEARRKQYEYYRDKLLSFKEITE